MAKGVEPDCRYGHGPLVISDVPEPASKPQDDTARSIAYFVPIIREGAMVNFGAGYVFELWRCTKCSYIELHDREALSKAEQS